MKESVVDSKVKRHECMITAKAGFFFFSSLIIDYPQLCFGGVLAWFGWNCAETSVFIAKMMTAVHLIYRRSSPNQSRTPSPANWTLYQLSLILIRLELLWFRQRQMYSYGMHSLDIGCGQPSILGRYNIHIHTAISCTSLYQVHLDSSGNHLSWRIWIAEPVPWMQIIK